MPSHTYCPWHAKSKQLLVSTIFVLPKVSGGSGPLCLDFQATYHHIPASTLKEKNQQHQGYPPQVTGTASPLLNAATPPEHRVTHDQPTSLTEGAVGADGKWIIYQLHISIHNITPYSHGQLTKAKLYFIDLHSTCCMFMSIKVLCQTSQ